MMPVPCLLGLCFLIALGFLLFLVAMLDSSRHYAQRLFAFCLAGVLIGAPTGLLLVEQRDQQEPPRRPRAVTVENADADMVEALRLAERVRVTPFDSDEGRQLRAEIGQAMRERPGLQPRLVAALELYERTERSWRGTNP